MRSRRLGVGELRERAPPAGHGQGRERWKARVCSEGEGESGALGWSWKGACWAPFKRASGREGLEREVKRAKRAK